MKERRNGALALVEATPAEFVDSFKSNPPLGQDIFLSHIFLLAKSRRGKCGRGK